MEETTTIQMTVNGTGVTRAIPTRRNLVDFLRIDLGLTGSHVGCEHGACGACTVRVDGVLVRGCLMFAVQADRLDIETIEGADASSRIADLQENFRERAALQCGFCTPGMLLTAAEFLARNPAPSRIEIREAISGNFCRCTGYEAIVDAIETTAQARAAAE